MSPDLLTTQKVGTKGKEELSGVGDKINALRLNIAKSENWRDLKMGYQSRR